MSFDPRQLVRDRLRSRRTRKLARLLRREVRDVKLVLDRRVIAEFVIAGVPKKGGTAAVAALGRDKHVLPVPPTSPLATEASKRTR